jgi:hypothetical protein
VGVESGAGEPSSKESVFYFKKLKRKTNRTQGYRKYTGTISTQTQSRETPPIEQERKKTHPNLSDSSTKIIPHKTPKEM